MFVSQDRVNCSEDTPVTDPHVPHYNIPDLYEGPFVLGKCWKVSFNEDIWSEPGVLHLQVNVLFTEQLVEASYRGLAQHHVGEGVSEVRLVLHLQVGRDLVPHLVWPAGELG